MKPALAGACAAVIAVGLGAFLAGCGSPYDRDCIRRHATLPREQWCLGERTQDNDEHEPFEPAAAPVKDGPAKDGPANDRPVKDRSAGS